jgi:hypothetical protein
LPDYYKYVYHYTYTFKGRSLSRIGGFSRSSLMRWLKPASEVRGSLHSTVARLSYHAGVSTKRQVVLPVRFVDGLMFLLGIRWMRMTNTELRS